MLEQLFMKKTIILIFTLIWLSCSLAQNNNAATTTPLTNQSQLQQVQMMLSKANHLTGDFTQTQHIALLSKPLVSTGHFTLTKDKGLTWLQNTPFNSKLTVTPTRIEQKLADNPATIITKEQQPIVFSFTNIFLAVFNGDTKNISEYFHIDFKGDTSQWNIILKPIAAPLDKAISSIELAGDKYVHSIVINDAKNNHMLIQLSNVKEQ
jgi:outer membrane lipoprotein-sorting protein